MPTTPRGLPFPGPNDPPAGNVQMQQLAEAIDGQLNKLPAGFLARQTGSNQTDATSTTWITHMTVAFTVPDIGTRRVRFSASTKLNASATNIVVAARVLVSATTATSRQALLPLAGGAGQDEGGSSGVIDLAPGAYTALVQVAKLAGTGTGSIVASNLDVEDIGQVPA